MQFFKIHINTYDIIAYNLLILSTNNDHRSKIIRKEMQTNYPFSLVKFGYLQTVEVKLKWSMSCKGR